jgi:hypothetical protein
MQTREQMLLKLEAMRKRNDAARGRELTAVERAENLRRAIDRTCIECGREVEPKAKCPDCGWINF